MCFFEPKWQYFSGGFFLIFYVGDAAKPLFRGRIFFSFFLVFFFSKCTSLGSFTIRDSQTHTHPYSFFLNTTFDRISFFTVALFFFVVEKNEKHENTRRKHSVGTKNQFFITLSTFHFFSFFSILWQV